MKTTLAVNKQSKKIMLPGATAKVGNTVFVSCQEVQLEDGVLRRTRDHYTVPAAALSFFGAEIRNEEWLGA